MTRIKLYLFTERSNDIGELEVHSIEVSRTDIQKLFHLNYCITLHNESCISHSLQVLFDSWDFNKFGKKHWYAQYLTTPPFIEKKTHHTITHLETEQFYCPTV